MIAEPIAELAVPIDSVKPYGDNPRQGDVGAIAASLEANGQYRPIVVNQRDGVILAGNHTWLAARSLGWESIAATYVDVDEATAQRIVLVDNRSSDLAAYDEAGLAEMLQALIEDGGGSPDALFGTGFDGDDLDDLLADLDDYEGAAGVRITDPDESYDEFLDRYANRAVRSLVCDYPFETFKWLVAQLDVARRGDETNADVVARLVADATGSSVPTPVMAAASNGDKAAEGG